MSVFDVMSVKSWAVEGPDGELILRPDKTVRLWRTREAATVRPISKVKGRKVVRVEIVRV